MNKIFFYKTLKILLGVGLIIKGIEFIKITCNLFHEMNIDRANPNVSCFYYIENPIDYLLPGLYILLLGVILIYCFPLFLKIIIAYNLIMTIYFLSYFVLFSIFYFSINISADFFHKIFIFSGMFFSTILICRFNDFDWRNQIKNSCKIALIIGIILAFVQFASIFYYY